MCQFFFSDKRKYKKKSPRPLAWRTKCSFSFPCLDAFFHLFFFFFVYSTIFIRFHFFWHNHFNSFSFVYLIFVFLSFLFFYSNDTYNLFASIFPLSRSEDVEHFFYSISSFFLSLWIFWDRATPIQCNFYNSHYMFDWDYVLHF